MLDKLRLSLCLFMALLFGCIPKQNGAAICYRVNNQIKVQQLEALTKSLAQFGYMLGTINHKLFISDQFPVYTKYACPEIKHCVETVRVSFEPARQRVWVAAINHLGGDLSATLREEYRITLDAIDKVLVRSQECFDGPQQPAAM